MFKLESYITPLLMGYLDKYVKLRQEDFQLSLWGGDAVLNNLDLRLDELEKVIQLPVMFQSGHIHELRLHVPWTKLGSEPVVITINTVECILKVRDTAYEASSSRSGNTPRHSVQQKLKMKRRIQPTEDLPPGYLQSIVNRIINNVTFIINNLILKFVEDDIVLSVNIKSAECYSVDKEWNRAFVDLTPDDLALRKMLNFADLTVCMDKTNSSGHIESYQEPVAYRCAVTCRLHMEYESVLAKFPRVTRFNLYCDTLNLSLTDTQLPMLVRLIELCIALYYGTLDIPTSETVNETAEFKPSDYDNDSVDARDTDSEADQTLDQGWVSWAWSYVPQILPTEEEEAELEKQLTEQGRRGKPAPHILSLGFYIHQGTILFKLTERSRESTELPHRKIHFHPFLRLNVEGLGIEVLIQDITFCNIQCGITSFRLSTCGNCICGIPDEKVSRCNTLLRGGELLQNKSGPNYITNSLFDDMSLENRGKRSQHIVDGEEHRQVYTEQQALQRFGAFWVDSLYTFEKPEKHGAGSNSSETDSSEPTFQKEFSTLRFVLGNTHLYLSSTLYHRVSKFIHCAKNHQYQPYGSSKSRTVLTHEDRSKPTEEQVKSLEDFIPTHLLHLMVINPTVTVMSAEHPHCDVAKKNYKSHKKKGNKTVEEQHQHPAPIPAVVLSATRFDLQITKPMYPDRLVKLVTAIAGPSSNLLHHCHTHMQIKLFSFQTGLQRAAWDGKTSRLLTLVPPCSFALYSRSLVLAKLWTNSSLPQQEWMYEIPSASLNVNKANVLLCSRVLSSWMASSEKQSAADFVLDDSLLDDLFPPSGESTHHHYPLLEIGLYGLEFKSCESALVSACVASLSSLHVFLYTPGIGGKMSAIPIIYGPEDTSGISEPDFFTGGTLGKSEVRSDCITATFQKPKHTGVSEAQALALVDCQGLCVWLDPGLISWFHYCPQPRPGRKSDHPPVTLDLSLAQLTSPLNAVSNASLHSTSSPSHPGRQTTSLTVPTNPEKPASIAEESNEEKAKSDDDGDSLGKQLAHYFPLLRMLHVQVELKPSAVFLPKTSIPNLESVSDILAFVHQARHAGRLSDTLVICVPSVVVTSTMTKPMSIVQELPVTSIQGSLIGEKLPWTVKISNLSAYSLQSGKQDPVFFLHPMDIVSTLAVNGKYSPPTSETISTLALCLHIDVGQPKIDLSASQLQLCHTVLGAASNLVSNASLLTEECMKLFIPKQADKFLPSPRAPAGQKKSVSSTNKIESVKSAENITVDISEDFSHEGSPLHESIIDNSEEAGVKLSLWLQLLIPKLSCNLYASCPFSDQENGVSLTLEHFDLSMDSQNVYSKAKVTLGSLSIQQAVRRQDGTCSWTEPEGIVLSCTKQLPDNLVTVTNKIWASDGHTAASLTHPEEPAVSKDKKKSVLSITFTRALCKNVKKRLCKANVDLPNVIDQDSSFTAAYSEYAGKTKHGDINFYFHEYLSEVCLKSEPLDLVLKPELLGVFSSLLTGLNRGGKTGKVHSTELKSGIPKLSQSKEDNEQFGSTSVHNLPLLYADIGKVRIFIPKSKSLPTIQADDHDKFGRNGNTEAFAQEEQSKMVAAPVHSTVINIDMNPALPESATRQPLREHSSINKTDGDYSKVQTEQPLSSGSMSQGFSNAVLLNDAAVTVREPTVSGAANTSSTVCSTLSHDMMVVQVNSCMLQPFADNPLPRTAQEREIFQFAVQSGITHQPGSAIEDRQYQVDIKGVSVSTGLWDQVLHEMKQQGLRKSPLESMVQIPALDWNTFLMDSPVHEARDIKLIPLVAPFDLCLVLAPPITYISKGNSFESGKAKVICGFTSELNLTSDLDLFLNTSQVKLLMEIGAQFDHYCFSDPHRPGSHTVPTSQSPQPVHEGRVRNHQAAEYTAGVDSGVESDLSTFTLDLGQRHVTHRSSPQIAAKTAEAKRITCGAEGGRRANKVEEELSKPLASMPPVDILVTAGRVSCTVYTHKVLEETLTVEQPLFIEKVTPLQQTVPVSDTGHCIRKGKDNLEHILSTVSAKLDHGHARVADEEGEVETRLHTNEEHYGVSKFLKISENSLKKVISQGSICVVPFVYLYVTQPHCIVSKRSQQEVKMEVSCYDILVKAASDGHVLAVEEGHVIPDNSDCSVHWLETRAGCPNPYTGIPPSLLTARFVKEADKADTISIFLERPIRLKATQLVVEQVATFYSEINSIFPRQSTVTVGQSEQSAAEEEHKNQLALLSLAERLEVSTSQVVVCVELTDGDVVAGVVLSLEGATLEADCNRGQNPSVTAHIHLKDIVAKTSYQKMLRPLLGPVTINVDCLLSWIPISDCIFKPQMLFDADLSLVPVTLGQEHLFCLSQMSRGISKIVESATTSPCEQSAFRRGQVDRNPYTKSSDEFVQDRSHDDLRCGGFQFIEQPEGSTVQPDVGEIVFSVGDAANQENSSMSWHYPNPRVITSIHLTPVPFRLSSSTLSLDSNLADTSVVPCVLQYWDELRGGFEDVAEFHLSENESVTVRMPEPKQVNSSELVIASIWRVMLLQAPQGEGSSVRSRDVAVLPASLAACMCVDSAIIPSLIPSVQLSVAVPAVELHMCHHLKYNGSDLPKRLSLYQMCTDLCEEQVFALIRLDSLAGTVSHISAQEGKTNIKLSSETSVSVLEYGHLTMQEIMAPTELDANFDISNKGQNQDIVGNIQIKDMRLKVGKSSVHTLNMAVMAWSTFSPTCSGPHLIFSYYVMCNNTASTIRFGQAGTDENIVLNSQEMCPYRWRTHNCPQLLHLCMDKPSWKWTEPFPIDKESTSVRNVTARDQSYLVIVKVKRLANLQMQVTVFGQLIVSNRLSQPISMRISHTAISSMKEAKGENGQVNEYVIQPGTQLPSLVSSEMLLNGVQFRLAGFATSWSHDIFLAGDRMKDNQMIKISLPYGSTYFHIWCRIFCQHFHGTAQKLGTGNTATMRMIMLSPLYVVRTNLPHPIYLHLDSPKVKKSQEIMIKSQGHEFQLHCMGGDVTHQMSFRLCSGMLLSSPAVVLSTGLISQLTRNQVNSVDIEQMCEQKMDAHHGQWPYLMDDSSYEPELHSDIPSTTQVILSDQKDWSLPGHMLDSLEMSSELQPSIDLSIRLSEYIPGCDTLVVEVSPSYLLHNATDVDVIVTGSEGNNWEVKPGHTMAPPLMKDGFKLSVKYQNKTSLQKFIPMSNESKDYRRYNGDIGRVLFIDGYVHASFLLPLQEANKTEVMFLTVTSREQHGIRVICIRERFALSNQTGKNLLMKLLSLPLSLQRVKMSEIEAVQVMSCSTQETRSSKEHDRSSQTVDSCSHRPNPLFRWLTVQSDPAQQVIESIENETDDITFVCYISFSLNSEPGVSSPRDWQWSVPVRVVSSKDGHRMTTSVPDYVVVENVEYGDTAASCSPGSPRDYTPISHALCVVTQQVTGVTYIVVTNDAAPACVVENLCSFGLEFGQACDKLAGNDAVVQEQVELVSDLPWVPPGGWCHYTPPIINSEFVTKDTITIPSLHIRAADIQLPESSVPVTSEWSTGIHISGNLDAFVRLPGFCDLKILIQVIGMVTHLIIRPVSKAEITAKEIRSRIVDHGKVKVVHVEAGYKTAKVASVDSKFETTVDVSSSDTATVVFASKEQSSNSSLLSSELSTVPTLTEGVVSKESSTKQSSAKKHVRTFKRFSEKKLDRTEQQISKTSLTLGVMCSSFMLAIQDESQLDSVSDLVAVHLRDVFFACYPVSQSPGQASSETSFAISVGEAQIDNQQYGIGSFDFPVVLIPQKLKEASTSIPSVQNVSDMSVLELHAIMKSKAFLHVQIVTFSDPVWNQSVIQTVDVSLKPLSLYIDDSFVYRLVEELEAFIPSRLPTPSRASPDNQRALIRNLPAVITLNSYTLSHPIRMKHMTIHPIKLLLSVHASLKLFLASDHTPLSLSKFERVNVYSTFHRLAHALTIHYASAAVFRAGIVVGSLEILGNPTGLVRSIGTGVSDLVSLPYSGLTQGPGAFIAGLSMGFGSLVKNVSAGMITSVTNFASSVSRNMDRLSFDSSHLERQEENRRNRPAGVSDGLKQGLTGFGISLLGAVAGLADQPIQTLLASGTSDKHRTSASSTASDLVTGVGKGLVGVFTKPIGGAAEFVSQTGQGILQGTGLAQLPTRLEKPSIYARHTLPNSLFKYIVKTFSSIPNPELLVAVPAITLDLTGSEVKVELLLTNDVLVVVNIEEDAQQQAFTLSELECHGSYEDDDDGKVILHWIDHFYGTSSSEQSHHSNKDRIAAFIDTQNSTGHPSRALTSLDHSEPQPQSDNQSESGLPAENLSYSRHHSEPEVRPIQSPASPQYEFQMKPHLQHLFLTMFRLAKNRLQGRGFPV